MQQSKLGYPYDYGGEILSGSAALTQATLSFLADTFRTCLIILLIT